MTHNKRAEKQAPEGVDHGDQSISDDEDDGGFSDIKITIPVPPTTNIDDFFNFTIESLKASGSYCLISLTETLLHDTVYIRLALIGIMLTI